MRSKVIGEESRITKSVDQLIGVDNYTMQMNPQLQVDLHSAIRKLNEGWSVCAVKHGALLGEERGRRLAPALALLEKIRGADLERDKVSCAFADTVLGLAAFRLARLLGAETMYGEMASAIAVAEGKRRGIPVVYHRLVPVIMNMRQDGLCPMEHLAFKSASDYEFYLALRRRV